VPRAPFAIVAADFNRDGVVDVATANMTSGVQEECGPLWGTVSLLPGNGVGGLGAPASFQPMYDPAEVDRNTSVEWLAAARIDGDEHTDLIASGALLLNIPDAPNRAPTANAGADRTITDNNSTMLLGQAADPDNDRLTYQWVDEDGRTFSSCLRDDLFSPEGGSHTYTLIVRDDRGGTASDSVTIIDERPRGPRGRHRAPRFRQRRSGIRAGRHPVPGQESCERPDRGVPHLGGQEWAEQLHAYPGVHESAALGDRVRLGGSRTSQH
jgi:hypothetical protein